MKKIIVLHKNPDTARTIKNMLDKEKLSVITANCVEECIEKLKKEKPNLLLVESIIPREALLKAANDTKTKIIYIVSNGNDKTELSLYKNVIGYANEPFDINKFVKKIKTSLKPK